MALNAIFTYINSKVSTLAKVGYTGYEPIYYLYCIVSIVSAQQVNLSAYTSHKFHFNTIFTQAYLTYMGQ